MNTEQVYIAHLKECFKLKTADIESLIDTVPAYTEKEWEQGRIDSKEAEKIAKAIAKSKDRIVIFLNKRDAALEKENPGADEQDNYRIRMREIEAIDRDYDLFLWVYEKFLDVLILNKDDAVSFITSRPHILKPGVPVVINTQFAGAAPQLLADPVANTVVALKETAPVEGNTKQGDIHIPQSLWKGKRPSAVREAMKSAGYEDAVIAHVLNKWCGQTDTAIGELLHIPKGSDPQRGLTETACRRRSHTLREKVAAITITTS